MSVSTRVVISTETSPFADQLAESIRTVYTPTLITLDLRHKHVLVAAMDHRLRFVQF